ncbi:hypothetical protein GCM10009616_39950 [Microlunatus lacustris]
MTGSAAAFGQDPAEASWLVPRLTGRWGHVGGVVPVGFEAYGRVLHPVRVEDQPPISWSAVAEAAGTQLHALAPWHRVAPRQPGADASWWQEGPDTGTLDPASLVDLLDVLRRHTTTAEDCWFCLWSGYGWIHGSPAVSLLRFQDGAGWAAQPPVPPAFPAEVLAPDRLVELPGRSHLLARGPLDAATRLADEVTTHGFGPQSPNLFWPSDRRWCVATEIDLDSTLVGGTGALISELLGHDRLEVFRVRPDDSLQDDGDRINRPAAP